MRPNLNRRKFIALGAIGVFSGVPSVASSKNGFTTGGDFESITWPSYRVDGANSGTAGDIDIEADLNEQWSKSVDDPREGGVGNSPRISPPVRSHRIIVYTTDKAVVARGTASGKEFWTSTNEDSCSSRAAPTVLDDTVITGYRNVSAWDIETGRENWETELTFGRVASPLNVHDGKIYVGTTGGTVAIIDAEYGSIVQTVPITGDVTNSVAVDNTGVYAVSDEGTIKKIEGNSTFKSTLSGTQFQAPILTDDSVIVTRVDFPDEEADETTGIITILDKESLSTVTETKYTLKPNFNPAYENTRLFIANSGGDIEAYQGDSNIQDWYVSSISAAPVIVDTTLLVGTEQGEIIGIDTDSGGEIWRYSILDEPISGIGAGENTIFVTGKYSSIGAVYPNRSTDARLEVESLIERFIEAKKSGIRSSAAVKKLVTASNLLSEGDYTESIATAEEGIEIVNSEFGIIESTRQTIRTTRQKAMVFSNTTNFDSRDILNTTEEAEAELNRGNPQAAKRLADAAAAEIENVEAGYQNATEEITKLEETISEARDNDIPLGNITDNLDRSRSKLEQTNFEEAVSVAATTRSKIETRHEQVQRYRSEKRTMEVLVDDASARGIQINDEKSRYRKAMSRYEQGEYATAAELMSTVSAQTRRTVNTATKAAARIEKIESFDPIAPFVTTVAKGMGSQESLQRAQRAYESGEYERSLEEATKAREAQLGARFVIDGGVVTAIGGGAVAHRYDALSMLSKYIADSTSENETKPK